MNKIKFILMIISLLCFNTNIYAMHEGEHESEKSVQEFSLNNLDLKPNEIVLEVHGVVCSFCSQGIQKKLSKLSFVDTKKFTKGSEINIENQTVKIAIKENKKADLDVIFNSIKSGGYNPIKAYFLDSNGKVKSMVPSNE